MQSLAKPASADEIKLLKDMLGIYSPSRSEAPHAMFLADVMNRMGMNAEVDAAGNAVGQIGTGPLHILFLGHIDTVPGEIEVRVEENDLYGRGAVDAKGPTAAFLSALGRVLGHEVATGSTSYLESKTITYVGAVEEECATSKGARFVMDRFNPDFLIVGEPSGWNGITVGYKGRLLVHYSGRQESRHTATPGKSVCEELVDFWNPIKAYAGEFNEGKKIFETLDPSLRKVVSNSDGLADTVEATIAFRVPESITIPTLRDLVQSFEPVGALQFSSEEEAVRSPRSTPLASAFVKAIRAAGGEPKFKLKTGTSDMNVVATKWHCPMVAYGPGDSSLDHTPNEHINMEEYGMGINVLEDVLRRLA